MDNILNELAEAEKNYRRGLITAKELSDATWDILSEHALYERNVMKEYLPLVADYLITDDYAMSQFNNALAEDPRKPHTMVLDEVMRKAHETLNDEEELAYYRAYLVLYYAI